MKILDLFKLPIKAQVDRRIYIKDILHNLELNSRDKRTFETSVETVHLKGILNESTQGLWSYVDENYFYKEIDIFYVVLKDISKFNFINEQLQKVFPNPIIIFYEFKNK